MCGTANLLPQTYPRQAYPFGVIFPKLIRTVCHNFFKLENNCTRKTNKQRETCAFLTRLGKLEARARASLNSEFSSFGFSNLT